MFYKTIILIFMFSSCCNIAGAASEEKTYKPKKSSGK